MRIGSQHISCSMSRGMGYIKFLCLGIFSNKVFVSISFLKF